MSNQRTTIQAGDELTARSISDWECIYRIKIESRNGNFVTVTGRGLPATRKKVYTSPIDGREYVMAYGKYSMAPIFYGGSQK